MFNEVYFNLVFGLKRHFYSILPILVLNKIHPGTVKNIMRINPVHISSTLVFGY